MEIISDQITEPKKNKSRNPDRLSTKRLFALLGLILFSTSLAACQSAQAAEIPETIPAPAITRINVVATPERPTDVPTIAQSPTARQTPTASPTETKKIPPTKSPTSRPVATMTQSSTATPMPQDELFADETLKITLKPNEIRLLNFKQIADHSKFCLAGADNTRVQVGFYDPPTLMEFSGGRFRHAKVEGNFDKVMSQRGCDQFAATGAGAYAWPIVHQYWKLALHNNGGPITVWLTMGDRLVCSQDAPIGFAIDEHIGPSKPSDPLIRWTSKKCD